MNKRQALTHFLQNNPDQCGKVVDYDSVIDKLYTFNFTTQNTGPNPNEIADTKKFCAWVEAQLAAGDFRYGIGGYMEHRPLYNRSELFNAGDQARRLHLGTDIWARAGTPVYAPLAGVVHSFKDNDHFGDYGPTIILQHNLDGLILYSLYGHLNRECLTELYVGKPINKNQIIAAFGTPDENGGWPPHLHFQLMFDMQGWQGDYPGVGKCSDKEQLMANIPDPELILKFNIHTPQL